MRKREEKTGKSAKATPAKKILQTATTVLLIICTVLCFAVVINSAVNKDKGLFGFRLFYVVSGSMEPTLPVGSMLVVGESKNYVKDDIITFYSKDESIEGYPNTHRIIDVIEEDGQISYITQGDANGIPDEIPVSKEDVIGKMYFCINASFLRNVVEILGTPIGFFIIILLPILAVAVICMRDFKKAMSEELRRAALESLEKETSTPEDPETQEESLKDETERNDKTE